MRRIRKAEVILDTAMKTGISQVDVSTIFMHLLDIIANHMIKGNPVFLRRFGTFMQKIQKGRIVRNPKTGETLFWKGDGAVKLRFSDELKRRINEP